MVSYQYLTYFMKICETRSMNRAAAELYISQPALSLAVRKLETQLGVTLLTRSNRGIAITEDGELLLRHCILLMKQMSLIENIAHERPEPFLSVSAFPYIVSPRILLELKEDPAFKDIRIEYEECRVLKIFENVDRLVSQLGIIQFNNHQQRIVEQKAEDYGLTMDIIATTPWAVALGPNSPLYDRESVAFEELKDHRLIRMKDDMISFITGEVEADGMSIGDLPYDNIQSCQAAEFLLANTRSYMLCGMQNPFMNPAYGLKVLPLRNLNITVNIASVVRRSHKPDAAERRFLKLLSDSLEGYNKVL